MFISQSKSLADAEQELRVSLANRMGSSLLNFVKAVS